MDDYLEMLLHFLPLTPSSNSFFYEVKHFFAHPDGESNLLHSPI